MLTPAKAKGSIGSWFATVEGESLPCVHKHWTKGIWPLHHDPFQRHGADTQAKIDELVDAILRLKRVILTDDVPKFGKNDEVVGFDRKRKGGYIAIYAVEDVTYSQSDGLRFRLTDRIRELE